MFQAIAGPSEIAQFHRIHRLFRHTVAKHTRSDALALVHSLVGGFKMVSRLEHIPKWNISGLFRSTDELEKVLEGGCSHGTQNRQLQFDFITGVGRPTEGGVQDDDGKGRVLEGKDLIVKYTPDKSEAMFALQVILQFRLIKEDGVISVQQSEVAILDGSFDGVEDSLATSSFGGLGEIGRKNFVGCLCIGNSSVW